MSPVHLNLALQLTQSVIVAPGEVRSLFRVLVEVDHRPCE